MGLLISLPKSSRSSIIIGCRTLAANASYKIGDRIKARLTLQTQLCTLSDRTRLKNSAIAHNYLKLRRSFKRIRRRSLTTISAMSDVSELE
ncbi:MAG: hypothetical protein RMY29_012025 [Nostoc sp. CreGUA01]|nr:hypothetical protein [Nostoc sp. CreGUA01]